MQGEMSTPRDTLRERVRALLLEAGFDRAGFASAAAPAPARTELEEWLARGFHGEMHWLARDVARRTDPALVLPGARTVCVLAVDYRESGAFGIAAPESDRAEISAYARGTDYHRVIERRLRDACRALAEAFPEERFRWYVDTGPVLEKAWAARAGIGWVGKNTCSIDPEHGSFFFLATILTTLDLPPDPPAVDHCGTCRLCIDACPTRAIVAPYVLDARLCISYQTIEARGEVPPAIEEASANLIFGCDICQEVCPWNREARGEREEAIRSGARAGGGRESERESELAPRHENIFPRLAELAELDEASFRARFPQSAVRRAGFRGFLRNVMVACGNSGRRELLPVLDALSERSDVRGDPVLEPTLARARARLSKAVEQR